jgi:hypothetical protein
MNPAKTLRWSQNVGTIEVGKFADLMVIRKPNHPSTEELPDSPYRNLIDATEKDVELVLVGGQPLAGDVDKMALLKPGDYEVITSTAGCFQKAVDVTNPLVGRSGTETFATIQQKLKEALNSMAGDNPPAGGGPAELSNTYHQLKHLLGYDALSDEDFNAILASKVGFTPNRRLNIEAVQLAPVLIQDDDFYFHLLGGELFPGTNLIADFTPPFGLYPTNLNQLRSQRLGDPSQRQRTAIGTTPFALLSPFRPRRVWKRQPEPLGLEKPILQLTKISEKSGGTRGMPGVANGVFGPAQGLASLAVSSLARAPKPIDLLIVGETSRLHQQLLAGSLFALLV